MKKIICLVLVILSVVLVFAACGKGTDLDYVVVKGKLIVGITDNTELAYLDDNGEWAGFDIDLAKAFGEHIGVNVEFVQISIDDATTLLEEKKIDCVWNGVILTDIPNTDVEYSYSYFDDSQVVVTKTDVAYKYNSIYDLKEKKIVCVADSEGFEYAMARKNSAEVEVLTADSIESCLQMVNNDEVDAAIVRFIPSAKFIGEKRDFPDLSYSFRVISNYYTTCFRKDSNIAGKLNDFLSIYGNIIDISNVYNFSYGIISYEKKVVSETY